MTVDRKKIPFFGVMFDVQLSILGPSGELGLPLRVGLSCLEKKTKSNNEHRILLN